MCYCFDDIVISEEIDPDNILKDEKHTQMF